MTAGPVVKMGSCAAREIGITQIFLLVSVSAFNPLHERYEVLVVLEHVLLLTAIVSKMKQIYVHRMQRRDVEKRERQ